MPLNNRSSSYFVVQSGRRLDDSTTAQDNFSQSMDDTHGVTISVHSCDSDTSIMGAVVDEIEALIHDRFSGEQGFRASFNCINNRLSVKGIWNILILLSVTLYY